jgi:broad specificity phosphatase PhoE
MDPKIVQYFRMGYELTYVKPTAEPGIPLDEPWMSYYRQGMEAGRAARAEADSRYEGPSIGPAMDGESYEQYQRHIRELLEELFHKHEPHIEVEPPEVVFGR